MNFKGLYVALALFALSQAFSQGKGSFQKDYLEAKSFFRNEKYLEAFDKFKSLAGEHKNNYFEEYAAYYAGLSAYHLGNFDAAERTLESLIEQYPKWSQLSEAHYLLGVIAFEKGELVKAFDHKLEIEGDSILKDYDDVQSNYIDSISVEELKSLNLKYPDEQLIAKSLLVKLMRSAQLSDKMYCNYLKQEYVFLDSNMESHEEHLVERKDVYTVALLFPFKNKNGRDESKYLQFVQGVKIGVDSLEANSKPLKLIAYDTKGDSLVIKRILKDLSEKGADLIFTSEGQGYLELIDGFARKRHIQVINPYLEGMIKDSVYSNTLFLKPSACVLANEIANYSMDSTSGRDVLIVYGKSEKDSVFAHTYKKRVEAHVGKTVHTMMRIDEDNITNISQKVRKINQFGDFSHILVATKNNLIGSYVVTALEKENLQVPVFAPDSWLDIQTSTFEQYRRRNVFFYSNIELDRSLDATVGFREKFKSKMNIKPVKMNAHYGFDMVMLAGSLIHQHGILFAHALNENGFTQGFTLTGVNYENSNSNQVVLLRTFDEQYNYVCHNCREKSNGSYGVGKK